MALLTPNELVSVKQFLTSFRNEEGYISFYKESDYVSDTTLRSEMTLLGTFLFTKGFTLNNSRAALPPQQAIGYRYPNLRPMESSETNIAVQGLYTQEVDILWARAGHPPLLAFVDFIDDSPHQSWQKDNILDGKEIYSQTIVIRDCRCTSKNITASDDSLVQWDLNFVCGELAVLPSEAAGEYEGAVLSSTQGTTTPGFGYNFGFSFGA